MKRQEKIQMAIDKGITCDVNTGKVYSRLGKELICKHNQGYKLIVLRNTKMYILLQHQFIYYTATGKIVDEIDHINGDKTDNRITNLREVTRQENCFNKKSKGYYWNKPNKKWQSQICLNGKSINLGSFVTETEASQAYLDAKKIYHIIS
jgi:hypothetical protein